MRTNSLLQPCALGVAALGLAVSGCRTAPDAPDRTTLPVAEPAETQPRPPTAPPDRTEVAAKYAACIELVNAGTWDRFRDDCLAPDYAVHEADGQSYDSPAAMIQMMQATKSAFPDFRIEPQLVVVSGNNLFAVGLNTGTQQGTLRTPIGDLPPTNRRMGQLFFHHITIDDNLRGTQEWIYSDPLTMLGQLGHLPDDAAPTRAPIDTGIEDAPIRVIAANDANERANLELVRRWNQQFNAHDIDQIMAMYAENAVESDRASATDMMGRDQIAAWMADFLRAFPDARIEVPTMVAAGDFVIARGTFTATHSGEFEGLPPPTNQRVQVSYAEVIRIADGQIAEVWRFRNGLAMAQQLGQLGTTPHQHAPTPAPAP
jgi:steroid delta-isomerase-like uncharacterized protein